MWVHGCRKNGAYENWGLHIWGDAESPTPWDHPLAPVGSDEYGVFWEVDAKLDGDLHFVVHQGDAKVEPQNLCPRTPLDF